MLKAVVVTIPKEGKDSIYTCSYKPILLLYTGVKLYSQILVHRLMGVLPNIVHASQVSFIAVRQALDVTRRVLNLLDSAGLCWTPSILLSLDMEKTFDRVHWGYLKAILLKFGFSGWILSALMSLYSSPKYLDLCTNLFVLRMALARLSIVPNFFFLDDGAIGN